MATSKKATKKRIPTKSEEPQVANTEEPDEDATDDAGNPTHMDAAGQLYVDDPNAETEDDEEDEDDDAANDDDEVDPNAVEEAPEGTPGFTQQNYPGMPRDGIVLAPSDPMYVKGEQIGDRIHLTEAVYRAVKPYRSNRWIFNQLYGRGSVVPARDVIKL